MASDQFDREFGARFTGFIDSAVDPEVFEACVDRDLIVAGDYHYALTCKQSGSIFLVGYDVGRFHSSGVITVVELSGGLQRLVFYKELIRARFDVQIEFLQQVCSFFNARVLALDASGQGTSVSELIKKDTRFKCRIIPVMFSG